MTKQALVAIAVLLFGAIILGVTVDRAAPVGEEVDVIVNKTNPIADLPMADAKKIFVGDKSTWPNGKRITLLMLAQGQPEREVVLREIYKMSEGDYSKYFLQAAFTGKVSAPPKDVGSAAEMKQNIAGNPGAVGYVKSGDADDSVKVVLKIP